MSEVSSPTKAEIAKRAQQQLAEAQIGLDQQLESVDARVVFASYALSRIAALHSKSDSKAMRPAPVAIELAAWLLFPHFDRPGSSDADDVQKTIDALEAYQSAFTFTEMFSGEEVYDELDSQLRIHTGMVRGSAYPIQVRRRIEGALARLEEDFRSRIGIGPIRAMEIALAIIAQAEANVTAMKALWHGLYDQLRRLQARKKTDNAKKVHEVRIAMEESLAGMGGAWIPSKDEVGLRVERLDQTEWNALHAAIGLSPDNRDSVARVVDLQDRPLYFTDPEHTFSLQGTTVLDAIFSFFDESARNDSKLVNRYVDGASDWMETAIAEQMRRIFPASSVFQSARFRDPDNPGGETEADVVVHWGPFLVVLEAKNNRVTKSAVRGGSKGLRNVLSKNIQNAFYQARRVLRVLEEEGKITFNEKESGRTLTVSRDRLRRVMPISVTLQHLLGITTQLAVTQQLGLFKGNAYPWSISIDDLDVVTRFAANPDVFLYYIERRTAHQGLGVRLSGDELDIFGQFLDNRLHPAIYEKRKEIAEHQGGPPMISFSGGEEKFAPFFVAEWYGETPPSARPALEVPKQIQKILDELRRRPNDDARYIAFALLSLNNSALLRIENAIERFRRGSGPAYQINRTTIHEGGVVVNVMVHQSLGREEFLRNVTVRTRIEHYRARGNSTVSFGIDLRKPGAFEIAQWLEGEWEYEEVMEDLLKNDTERSRIVSLPPGAPKLGRNDRCPCGSGKKFKKCCIDHVQFRKEDG